MQDLVCISHLRWDFVWQRPQHLLSRLAGKYRLFFVEEPVTNVEATEPYIDTFVGRGTHPVTVVRLMMPAAGPYWIGHNDPEAQPVYEQLLREYLASQGVVNPILWLYTPMASPFVAALQPSLLLYDVMDELSAFKGAPAELKAADRRLLGQADVVFTGGVSLYRARLPYAENIHLFPSGVEVDHFARAARESLPTPPDLADLPHPMAGYFGVVDERMDLPLLGAMAAAHPEWSIVMLGPVIKIDPADLPQASNLHFLGMKDYRSLPDYLAQFDIALVPFAMNESTRYLSPTKTLEYLAADKPVVATPIPDIVELYGDFVRIGATAPEFIAQMEAALAVPPEERQAQQARVAKLMALHTWDHIAEEMDQIIQAALARRTGRQHGNGAAQTVLAQGVAPTDESPVNSA